ncbi:MAG: hypothetical protein HOE48_18330 [Candidatus Latescibacteria bacterium]|nr:hypothetical protein [Candidatus Latescibacterota bacterium]
MTHATYITNGFIWLDHGDLELGRAVLPLSHLHEAFLTRFGETAFYRPLVTVIHSLDTALYHQRAPGYHLTNVILHLLASAAFALFLSQFLSLNYSERQGMYFIMVGPGVMGEGHAEYIDDLLDEDTSIWRICCWHKNQQRMQVGGKKDETGWEVYEEAREGGAIIATGHEHSYSRTHLLSNMKSRTIASTSDTLEIRRGRTFAVVSGLGGKSIRTQKQEGKWWASIYTADQGANFGALFGIFNRNGEKDLAEFYFKDITGKVVDRFWVRSKVGN